MPNNGFKDAVNFYRQQGLNVIPYDAENKKPLVEWSKYQHEYIADAVINNWVNDGMFDKGIAVICGKISNGFAGIDFDDKDKFDKLDHAELIQQGYWVQESNRGGQICARMSANIPTYEHNNGIDFLGEKRLCALTPSYKKRMLNGNITELPDLKIDDTLYNKFCKLSGKTHKKTITEIEKGVVEGERKVSAFKLACRYRDEKKTEVEIIELLKEWNKNNIEFKEPFTEREIWDVAKSVFKYPVHDIEGFQKYETLTKYGVFYLDDNGKQKINCPSLAKLILEADNTKYLVTKDNQDIYAFNGSFYEPIGDAMIKQRVSYYLGSQSKEYHKKEVVGYIKNYSYTDRQLFNPPLNLINFKNGIYDIDAKELKPHSSEHYFLYELPVNFNADAKCEKWLKFVEDVIYQDDKDFLQEECGFLLYRQYTWAILLILLGHGRNGKSTFINTITKILGEKNVTHMPLLTLAYNKFAPANLYGKHANLCADIGAKEINDTGLLKELTGQDWISAEEKMKKGFDFLSYAKLIFACNILPKINDDTLAMTERLAVIEFPNEFKKGTPECNPDILKELTLDDELSGILNWMLEGLHRLLKNKNFSHYRDFKNLVDYKEKENDPVHLFIFAELEPDANSIITKQELYNEYKKFCERHDEFRAVGDSWFGRKLNQYIPTNWNIESGQKGKTTWKGIKLKNKVGIQRTI